MVSVALSGCQDTSSIATEDALKFVSLDSTIVEFANVSFVKKVNKSGGIEAVTVGWMFHNIAGRMISAHIDVQFYDKNNVKLYNESKNLLDMPADYTEKFFSPGANRVLYGGPGAPFVDHVVIVVTEI